MTSTKEITHPWLTIKLGLGVLAITFIYYKILVSQAGIYHSHLVWFEVYTWLVVISGSIVTTWIYIKRQSLAKMWLLLLVLIANMFALSYCARLLAGAISI